MDDTGVSGLACRHDHILKFANIKGGGEKFSALPYWVCKTGKVKCAEITFHRAFYALALIKWILDLTADRQGGANTLGILYDIGCNVEKGILKVSLVFVS